MNPRTPSVVAVLWLTVSFCFSPQLLSAKRKALPRPVLPKKVLFQPVEKAMRFNVQTQQSEEFDPDPRIEFDETRGVYLISWVNEQGRRSMVINDPPIKLDVIVQGDVKPGSDGKGFLYIYSL